jgi:hypothetical protein
METKTTCAPITNGVHLVVDAISRITATGKVSGARRGICTLPG